MTATPSTLRVIPALYAAAAEIGRRTADPSKVLARAAARALPAEARGGLSMTAAAELVARLAPVFRDRRRNRVLHVLMARGIVLPSGAYDTPLLPRPTGRPACRLPAGSLAYRLAAAREAAVERADPMRRGAAGGGSYQVRLTDDPAAVGYTVTAGVNRTTYAGRYKGWAAREDHAVVTVPADWRVRVERRRLAVLGGLFTLDAAPLEGAPAGVALYAAVWAAQGRGYAVSVSRGYLAVSGRESYHGATPAAALEGLRRKLRGAEWAAKLESAPLDELAAEHAAVRVRIADARAIGACEYGIRSWCHATGLDYAAGEASVEDVYAAYKWEPRPEARLAILHALRRVRRLRLAA